LTFQNSAPSPSLAIPVATLRAQFHIQDGSRFNVSEIRAGLKGIADLYGTRGYADAKVELDTRIDDASQRIDLIIHITEGPPKH
jgi:outer membrane protein assembly factor BamA